MKKASTLTTVLVLTAAVLTACGCRNSRPAVTDPTTLPTVTVAPTTETATLPTAATTEPTVHSTIPDGNGPISTDTTVQTEPNTRMIPGGTGSGNGITGSITD